MSIQVLVGHASHDTAFQQQDYPYGFRLRCQRRCWLEFHPKHGYRLCTQTSNPKRPGLVWNKPKASTYATLGVMFLDDDGHVQWDSLHDYPDPGSGPGQALARVEAFVATSGAGLVGDREQAILRHLTLQASFSDERHKCQSHMQEMLARRRPGPGAHIVRKGAYVSSGYSFWSLHAEHAYVFSDPETAAALIAAYPLALKDATVLVRSS